MSTQSSSHHPHHLLPNPNSPHYKENTFFSQFTLEQPFYSSANSNEANYPMNNQQLPLILPRGTSINPSSLSINQSDQVPFTVSSPATTAMTRCQSKDEQEFYQDNSFISDRILSVKLNNSLNHTNCRTFDSLTEDNEEGSKLNRKSKKITKSSVSSKDSEESSPKKCSTKGKRSSWTSQEDAQLLDLMNIYGKKWSKIASAMKGRTGKQVRDRYVNVLMPDINRKSWDEDEDQIILSIYHKIGPKWSKIAESLKGRTEGQVKNRFYSFLRKKTWKEEETASTTKSYESEDLDVHEGSPNRSEKTDSHEYNKLQECLQRVEEISQYGLQSQNYPTIKREHESFYPNSFLINPFSIAGNMIPNETYFQIPDPTDFLSFDEAQRSEMPAGPFQNYWTVENKMN